MSQAQKKTEFSNNAQTSQTAWERLRASESFKDFSDPELQKLMNLCRNQELTEGQHLFHEGVRATNLYVVTGGKVDIKRNNAVGKEATVAELNTGDLFGEIGMIDQPTRTAGAVANGQVSVLEMSYQELSQLMVSEPVLAAKIYKAIAMSVSEKLKRTTSSLLGLIASSRLVAIGEMAGSIGHEINSPLSSIMILTQQLQRKIANSKNGTTPLTFEEIEPSLEKIKKTSERIAKVIKGLQSLCRDAESDPPTRIPLAQVLADAVEFCREKFRIHDVALDVDGIDPEIEVLARGVQVSQVILNLLNNAFDAIEKNQGEKWVKIKLIRTEQWTELWVSDCGTGIPPQVVQNMFQAFYTTKPTGKGTGLGLSISKKILVDHGGDLLYVADAPHTTFLIRLPR